MVKSGMADPKSEGYVPPEQGNNAQLEAAARYQEAYFERNGLDVSAHGTAYLIDNQDTDPDLGRELTAIYFVCQVNPHGGEELSSWELSSVFSALGTKTMQNEWLVHNYSTVQRTVNGELARVGTDANLMGAIQKQDMHTVIDAAKGYAHDLTPIELQELVKFDKAFKGAAQRSVTCGESGKVMKDWVGLKRQRVGVDLLMKKAPPLDQDQLDELQVMADEIDGELAQVDVDMKMIDLAMKSGDAKAETGEWNGILTAAIGIAETMAVNRQWLTNQSDLDPISKLWIYQGRMAELHPSNLEAIAKEFPAYDAAFRGMAALGTSKHALGGNGEVYPSGKYGYGYVDGAGKVVDVDDAVTRDGSGKINGLAAGITKLGENQIWVTGQGVVDVVAGKASIGGNQVEIFSQNILLKRKLGDMLKDSDVLDYLKTIGKFVRGKDKKSAGFEVDLAVAMAREFFEFSMLANWEGAVRDSKGKPYYVVYDNQADPKPILETISSNPDSEAVKFGAPVPGASDEATTYPYWTGGDWGKLAETRAKQMGETLKGRKHGLYALIPFLPENLVQPFLTGKNMGEKMAQLEKMIAGDEKVSDMFGKMSAVEHFKTYWLNIFKGVAVYDFISSNFIGDKDVTKAGDELMGLLGQTRTWEGLTKDIDLSLYWVDPKEAARLRVNIVLSALATVSPDFYYLDFMSLTPPADSSGLSGKEVSKIKSGDLKSTSNMEQTVIALRQLVRSRFVGEEDDVTRIIERIKSFKDGKTALGFSMSEFESEFGQAFLDRITEGRKSRMEVIMARQKADGKKK